MAGTSHVLARKYRPQVFADLIGQEALVQTITNAIEHNRLAHAYMLTGIRGVGKTSSARIIAKGLNCIGPDGQGGMTPNPCGQCKHCLEIAADSHIDVIEIDAASNTGVDNIREIIEGAKYNPVSARFKIYIIDEVHMLSKAAFNALLKTLEEPPERIKFIFATTEIRKVPITILSRCQRFDLKRLDETLLTAHLSHIAQQESIEAEEEALRLIARAGDGSCRDALSLLDQAMTQFNLKITALDVRQMLGLADRTSLFDLYESLMRGDVRQALAFLEKQYDSGADPLIVSQDLLSLTHWLTRIKIIPELAQDITVPEAERVRGMQLASTLSMASLTSAWQLLLKGLNEVKQADNPLIALEMVLIRLAFLAELPSPAQIIEDIKKNGLAVPEVAPKSLGGARAVNGQPLCYEKTQTGEVPVNGSSVSTAVSSAVTQTKTTPFTTHSSEIHSSEQAFSQETSSPSSVVLTEGNHAADTSLRDSGAPSGNNRPMAAGSALHSSTFSGTGASSVPSSELLSSIPPIRTLQDIADLAKKSGDRLLGFNIETYIRPVSIENGVLTCAFTPETPRSFSADLVRFLKDKTGVDWQIQQKTAVTSQTLKEAQAQQQDLLMDQLQKTPLIKTITECFPGAKPGRVKALVTETEETFDSADKGLEEGENPSL